MQAGAEVPARLPLEAEAVSVVEVVAVDVSAGRR
jgi:hypothetical protein